MNDCERQNGLVVDVTPVNIELTFAKSVAQVLGAENELEQGGEVDLVTKIQTDKLQKRRFGDSLVGQCEFALFIRSEEMLTLILWPERRMQALMIPECQVNYSFYVMFENTT